MKEKWGKGKSLTLGSFWTGLHRVMVYPANRSLGLRGPRTETVQEEIKDTIVHQLSITRAVKKSQYNKNNRLACEQR